MSDNPHPEIKQIKQIKVGDIPDDAFAAKIVIESSLLSEILSRELSSDGWGNSSQLYQDEHGNIWSLSAHLNFRNLRFLTEESAVRGLAEPWPAECVPYFSMSNDVRVDVNPEYLNAKWTIAIITKENARPKSEFVPGLLGRFGTFQNHA